MVNNINRIIHEVKWALGMNNEQFNNSKVNILGVQFNNTTMLEMTKILNHF